MSARDLSHSHSRRTIGGQVQVFEEVVRVRLLDVGAIELESHETNACED